MLNPQSSGAPEPIDVFMIPVGRWSDGTADPEVGMMMTHGQSPEQSRVNPEWNNAILHARISIGDTELMAADIPNAEPMRSAYLTLRLDSEPEASRTCFRVPAKLGLQFSQPEPRKQGERCHEQK